MTYGSKPKDHYEGEIDDLWSWLTGKARKGRGNRLIYILRIQIFKNMFVKCN